MVSNSHLYLEEKGEWSLAKITNILSTKGLHLDIDLASKYYMLSKDISETTKTINNDIEFFGYKNPDSDEEVLKLNDILLDHLENIYLKILSFIQNQKHIIIQRYLQLFYYLQMILILKWRRKLLY